MNKKSGKIFLVLVTVILIIISMTIKPNENKNGFLSDDPNVILANAEKESSDVVQEEQKEFININVDTYLDYYSNNDPKLVLIARPTCHYCNIAEPIISNIAYKYNLDVYYLNTDSFSDDDAVKIMNSNEIFKEGFGTPLLLMIKENKIVDMIDGLTDNNHYIDFMKRNEIIEE